MNDVFGTLNSMNCRKTEIFKKRVLISNLNFPNKQTWIRRTLLHGRAKWAKEEENVKTGVGSIVAERRQNTTKKKPYK